jgi:hypothetical protein
VCYLSCEAGEESICKKFFKGISLQSKYLDMVGRHRLILAVAGGLRAPALAVVSAHLWEMCLSWQQLRRGGVALVGHWSGREALRWSEGAVRWWQSTAGCQESAGVEGGVPDSTQALLKQKGMVTISEKLLSLLFILVLFILVLEVEPRASCRLSMHCAIELYTPSII